MPSENDVPPAAGDRRTRKREARRAHLLDLAADLVDRAGVAGVTMAALAEAADYAPASLYTYFPSRSALLSALQERALVVLGRVATDALAAWDHTLERAGTEVAAEEAALVRLWAFSELFLSAPVHHPREFRLQQDLLVTPGVEEVADASLVVPVAMHVLDVPRRLLAAAAHVGALHADGPTTDPLDDPLERAGTRTLAWVVALNGALLADRLVTGLPTTGARLGAEVSHGLLRGWGAHPDHLAAARERVASWPAPAAAPAAAAPASVPSSAGSVR